MLSANMPDQVVLAHLDARDEQQGDSNEVPGWVRARPRSGGRCRHTRQRWRRRSVRCAPDPRIFGDHRQDVDIVSEQHAQINGGAERADRKRLGPPGL